MKRMRRILVAVLCCSLALVTVAYATNATKTIQAAYRNIKLVIDGVPVTPRDSNGNVVEPFIYNGTTYLPVRAVGEALGKEVSWDGNTNTVYVGEAPGQVTYLLDVCPPYEKSSYFETPTTFVMAGKTYAHGFIARGTWNTAQALFNLNGEYSMLEFDFGHVDGSNTMVSDSRHSYHFYLDGKLVESVDTDPEALVQHYQISLDHALQLKIESGNSYGTYGFANVTIR